MNPEWRRMGDSLTRWKTKSTSLLALSFIPLGGLIFAVIWGVKRDFRAGDKAFHWPPVFEISDHRSLTSYLTIIGVFHSFIGYCVQELATRAAARVRTRALYHRTSSVVEVLNALPGSPHWQRYFNLKSTLTWKSFVRVGILYPAVSALGGILYKQALVLSAFQSQAEASYKYTFMTNCTNDIRNCPGNMYLKFGVALSQARFGGAHSKGVETTANGRRLTFVAAPTTAELTSLQRNITSLNATSLAMVADYQNVTSDETLPTPSGNIQSNYYRNLTVSLAFHGIDDLDWSVSAQQYDDHPYQVVRGMTRYCAAQCEWRTVNSTLSLQNYILDDANCTRLDLGFWSNGTTAEAIIYGRATVLSLMSDIIDENWNIGATHHDVLRSAYVVPAMYAVLVLGRWVVRWDALEHNSVTSGIILSPFLKVTQDNQTLAIETIPTFMVPYLIILVVVFIAHWTLGFFCQKTYVTEWAPLWFGLLTVSEQENIREEVKEGNIFESKGLKETESSGSKEQTLLLNV